MGSWERGRLAEGERRKMVRIRLVMEMSRLEWCVEADLSNCHGWVGVLCCATGGNRHRNHVFAF